MKRAIVVCATAVSACIGSAPSVQPCSSSTDCPAGAQCTQGLCQTGAPPATDGGGGDVGPPVLRTLSVERAGSGSVKSTPPGIDCGDTCTSQFDAGTSVSLSATPAAENVFDSWSGACSGGEGCTITLLADAKVRATFKASTPPPPEMAAITIVHTGSGAGSVKSTPPGIDCGATCNANFNKNQSLTLTATPADGSTFDGWSGPCSGASDCTFKPSADATVTAKFTSLCEGLTPGPTGTPITVSSTPTTPALFGGCEPGTGDSKGNMSVSTSVAGSSPKNWNYTFFDKAGTILGTKTYSGLPTVYGETTGYEGVVQSGSPLLYQLDAKGTAVKTVTLIGASQGFYDPTGGVVLYDQGLKQIRAFDENAVERWHVSFTESGFRLIGVDSPGHVLVLWDGTTRYGAGTLAGEWIDHDGSHTGAVFRAADALSPTGVVDVARRIPDGLYLSQDGLWLRELPSRAGTSQGAPAWLAGKPPTRLSRAHAGQAYALLTQDPSTSTTCPAQVEILTAAGRSCGVVPVPTSSGPCKTGALRITSDGTLLQLLPQPATCSSCNCTWRWFPGLFK